MNKVLIIMKRLLNTKNKNLYIKKILKDNGFNQKHSSFWVYILKFKDKMKRLNPFTRKVIY